MSKTPGANNASSESGTKFQWNTIPNYISVYLLDLIDLKKGVNRETTITEIRKKSSMAGANAWMLICSIVIASIGLSQDSQAVIIGAMLISPLMSPILGLGLSVGINDMELLKSSLLHFTIAIIIALLTSWIYFELTPFDDFTNEIKIRTAPTFLDILVAVFGGIAGIVSIARKDVSTTLPGVAIATALMPPLCVAGYGLANSHWDMASKSFYLFFLNSFFVALSTYLIVRFLKFPFKNYINRKTRNKNHLYIIIFSIALIVPSILIFRTVLKELDLNASMRSFSEECLGEDAKYLDNYKAEPLPDGSTIIYLKVYGDQININNLDQYKECLERLEVKNFTLEIISTSEVKIEDFNVLNKGLEEIHDRLEAVQKDELETKSLIQYFRTNYLDTIVFNDVQNELKVLFPDLEEVGISKMHKSNFSKQEFNIPVALLKWSNEHKTDPTDQQRIAEFLRNRLKVDSLKVITYD